MRRSLFRAPPVRPDTVCHRLPLPYQGSLDILLLGSLQVLFLPSPGLQSRGLQGSAIGEGQGPWLQQGALVDGVEIDRCLLLTLPSRQKGDSYKNKGQNREGALARHPGDGKKPLEVALESRPIGLQGWRHSSSTSGRPRQGR